MNNLTTSAALKQTLRLALPVIFSRVVNALGSFIGMIMIARLGVDDLAAGALISSLYFTFMLICWGILFSVGIMVSKTYGSGAHNTISHIVQQGLLLGVLISIPVMILMWHVGALLHLTDQDPQLIGLVQGFFHYVVWGIPFAAGLMVLQQFAIGVSRPRVVMASSCISLITVVSLSYIFIFGHLGFPRYGVTGLGLAFASNFVVVFLFLCGCTFFDRKLKHLHIFKRVKTKQLPPKMLKQLLSLGWPIGIQFGAKLGAISVLVLMIGLFGEDALAAQQISSQVLILIVMVPFGLSQATAVLVAQAYGRNDPPTVKKMGLIGMLLGGGFMVVAGTCLLIFHQTVISLYVNVNNPETLKVANLAFWFFVVMAIGQVGDAVLNIASGALRGLHDTRTPMWAGVMACWVIALPLAYLFGFLFNIGPVGIRMGFAISMVFASVYLVSRFFKATNAALQPGEHLSRT